MKTKINKIGFVIFFAILLSPQMAWAIYPPEALSGGRFFPGKGTRAASGYVEYMDDLDYSTAYGKTETGSFERQHYAKGLKLGIGQVRPSVAYMGEYDSNIFLSDDNAEGDYINKLLAGIDGDVVMDGGKYVLAGGVQTKSEWFASHGKQDHTDWTYQLGGEVHLEKLDLIVFDNFRDTAERTDYELTDRVQRYENRLQGLGTIPFGQFFAETEVTDFIVNFHENAAYDQFDRHEFNIYPRLGTNIGTKTQALVEYGYTNIGYKHQDDRDGSAHQGQLGIRGLLGDADLVTYQLWGGWQFRNYDNGNFENFNNFVAHGEMIYKPGAATRLILKGLRRPEESLDFGQTFYTRNEVSLQIRQQVAEQWFVNGRGGIGFNHYSNDRLDFLWEPAVGVEYLLPGKIFALFTEYKYSSRHSDQNNRDYGRHIANFGIRAQV